MNKIETNELIKKLKTMKLELMDLSLLKPDPLNVKIHPKEQVERIAQSVQKRWTNPILVDDNLIIVAGHGRRLAALHLGLEKVPVIVLHNLTEAERIQYQIFDNKSAEMAEWNWENLQAQMDKLIEMGADIEETGWTEAELDEMLNYLDDSPKTVEVEKLDKAPPVSENVKSCKGDVWICGEHRIMCGDSSCKENIGVLMQGTLADLVFTDPPYGVSYKGANNQGGRAWEIIKNDDLRGRQLFLFLKIVFENMKCFLRKNRAFYVWYANRNHLVFETAMNEVGLKSKQVLIWNKGMTLGHSDYHWAYEPCFYGCHEGENCRWFGDRTQKTVIETVAQDFESWPREQLLKVLKHLKEGTEIWCIKRDSVLEYLHPTQKPVELAQRAMTNSSNPGEVVLDLFGGSGSTMIAAENMRRKSRLMELDPRYCDVIVRRWQDFTKKQAVREKDGVTFDEAEERPYGGIEQE